CEVHELHAIVTVVRHDAHAVDLHVRQGGIDRKVQRMTAAEQEVVHLVTVPAYLRPDRVFLLTGRGQQYDREQGEDLFHGHSVMVWLNSAQSPPVCTMWCSKLRFSPL